MTKKLTNEAVVKRCLDLGAEGGLRSGFFLWWSTGNYKIDRVTDHDAAWIMQEGDLDAEQLFLDTIWFNHAWAKAVFGEEIVCEICGSKANYGVFSTDRRYKHLCKKCKGSSLGFIDNLHYHWPKLLFAKHRIDYMRKWLREKGKV